MSVWIAIIGSRWLSLVDKEPELYLVVHSDIGRILISEHDYGSESVCYVSIYPPSVLITLPSIFTSFIMAK